MNYLWVFLRLFLHLQVFWCNLFRWCRWFFSRASTKNVKKPSEEGFKKSKKYLSSFHPENYALRRKHAHLDCFFHFLCLSHSEIEIQNGSAITRLLLSFMKMKFLHVNLKIFFFYFFRSSTQAVKSFTCHWRSSKAAKRPQGKTEPAHFLMDQACLGCECLAPISARKKWFWSAWPWHFSCSLCHCSSNIGEKITGTSTSCPITLISTRYSRNVINKQNRATYVEGLLVLWFSISILLSLSWSIVPLKKEALSRA